MPAFMFFVHTYLVSSIFRTNIVHKNINYPSKFIFKIKREKNTRTRRKEHAKLNVEHEKRNQIETKGNIMSIWKEWTHKISGMKKYGT